MPTGLLQKLYNFTLPPVIWDLLMVHILTIVVIGRSLFVYFEQFAVSSWSFLFGFSWCFLDYQCGWEYFHASWPLWFPLFSGLSLSCWLLGELSHILAWPLSHVWVGIFLCDLPFQSPVVSRWVNIINYIIVYFNDFSFIFVFIPNKHVLSTVMFDLSTWLGGYLWFSTVVTLSHWTGNILGRSFEIRPTSPQNFVRQFSIQQFFLVCDICYCGICLLWFSISHFLKNLLVGILLWEETVLLFDYFNCY